MIQPYLTYYHHKSRKLLPDTNLCVVVNVAYMPKVCINPCQHGVIVISNTSNIEVKMHKTEVLVNYKSAYLKSIKNLQNLMNIIFTILMQIWIQQQCFSVPHNIMGYHTGNNYYAVVRNSPILVYLVRRKIEMQQTCVQQCIFMFSTIYHIVLFMAYAHMNIEQHVLCVPMILVL